jgi:hypothetical protein
MSNAYIAPSTYGTSEHGASGRSGHVLNDQGGRLVGVVVTDAEHAQAPPSERDRVARAPVEHGALDRGRIGGHAVQPLQLEPKHPVLRLRDRTACRAYRLRSVARAGDELADFRGSTGARTRCSLWPVSRCQPLPDFPQPCDSRLEQRSANGPGRIRTCDLGIKSPATRAAASCPRLKSAESSLRRGCSKRSQIAPFGDKLVRAPVRAVRPRIA